MDGIVIPFFPSTLWLFATALAGILFLIWAGYDVFNRRRIKEFLQDGKDVASLSARRQLLEADVSELRRWIADQKAELDHLTTEREEQERIRAELTDLERRCTEKENLNQVLRNEVGELENRRHLLSQTNETLERNIGDLEAKKAEAESIDQRLAELRRERDELLQSIRDKAETEARLAALTLEKTQLETRLQTLQREITPLEEKVSKLMRVLGQLREKREEMERASKELNEIRSRMDLLVNEKLSVENRLQMLTDKTDLLKADIRQMEQKAEQTRNELFSAEADLNKTNGEIQEKQSHLRELRNQWSQLEEMNLTLRNRCATLEHDRDNLMADVDRSKETRDKAATEVDLVKDQLDGFKWKMQSLESELGELQRNKMTLQSEVDELNARKAKMAQEFSVAKTGAAEKDFSAYKDLLEKPPGCLTHDAFQGPELETHERPEEHERNMLDRLYSELVEEQVLFPRRVLDAFHTCLKCRDINPLTVLAGVSGTGKTLLPIRYADKMGLHRLVVAVQPRWDSPQDMFGFYNYLEREYKATELSRSLVRLDPFNYPRDKFPALWDGNFRDRLLLVLLDEMNLARTEYYFSEFLSRLELRREVRDPKDPASRNDAEIELDAGPGVHRFRIWVPDNILFVGTMNEDETTQTLSDKVLDRSNVLRFGRPDESAVIRALEPEEGQIATRKHYLPLETWRKWVHKPVAGASWHQEISGWSKRLNSALEMVGRPFGFRVYKTLFAYVANYPTVEENSRHRIAFADLVEQKIIPKLRGIDVDRGAGPACLGEVEKVISEIQDNELEKAFGKAREDSRNYGTFQWHGVTRNVEDTRN